jgi:hypothetical protein
VSDGLMRDMFLTEGAPRSSIGSWALKKFSYDIHPFVYPFIYPFVAALVYGYIFWEKLWVKTSAIRGHFGLSSFTFVSPIK